MAKLKEKDEEHDKDVGEIRRLAEKLDLKEKANDKLTRQLKPMEEIINAKEALTSEVSGMKNGLLERDEKIAILETDNVYKDQIIQKLSESEILKENDGLRLQLAQKGKLIIDYDIEIKKLEALNEAEQGTTTRVISETRKMVRDFKENLPASLEPYDISTYIKNIQKRMEQFEGYLQTISI